MHQVLVIDDDPDIRSLLSVHLSSENLKVIAASSGAKGVEMATTGQPDVILLDINMPDMDGFSVLRKLRDQKNTKNIPVIMLTASSQRDDVANAMRFGIADYIKKPYQQPLLVRKIAIAIQRNKTDRLKSLENLSQHITLERDHNMSVVNINAQQVDKDLTKEAGIVFNPAFFTLTKKDNIVLDLRGLDTFHEADIPFIQRIMERFDKRKLSIVGGKHYGVLVAGMNFPAHIQLFISMGDLMVFLETQ